MHIDCHTAEILHSWSANGGRLLSGAVLVQFTLQDNLGESDPLRSRLVEYVRLTIEPGATETFRTKQLQRQACDQVRAYFHGDGKRENLFADGATQPAENDGVLFLSIMNEIDLHADPCLAGQPFDLLEMPAPDAVPASESDHPLAL